MSATSALHLSDHRRRQIACRPGNSLDVERGDNHLGHIRAEGGVHLFPLK